MSWKRTMLLFASGFFAGAIVAALLVSGKWRRDFEQVQLIGLAGQAQVATEIYAGRSDALAARILDELPEYLADMDRSFSVPVSTPLVRRSFEAAYRESGESMPPETRAVLNRDP